MAPIRSEIIAAPGSLVRVLRAAVLVVCIASLFGLAACNRQEQNQSVLESARQAFMDGNYSEAERLYESYIQAEPQGDGRWEAWNRLLDMALTVRNDRPRATSILDAMYLEFGDSGPRAFELLSRLAEIYEDMNNYGKAVEAWRKCLSLPGIDPAESARLHYRIARDHQAMKAYGQAVQELNLCIRDAQKPELAQQCRYTLAQNLIFMGRVDEAKEILRSIMANPEIEDEPRALAAFLLADVLEDQEKYAEAIDILESIRLTYPNPLVVDSRLKHLKQMKQ